MIEGKKVFALITARGGSKGIPKKCIVTLAGKPLIAYTIEQALKSKYIDRVVVSTDSAEIAEVAKKYGAEVPFSRPGSLAQDDSSSVSVIDHALCYFRDEEDNLPEILLLLQPTSPLRTVCDIDESLELFNDSSAESLVSVSHLDKSPYTIKKIEKGYLKDFISRPSGYIRRQDTSHLFLLNGAIYVLSSNEFLSSKIIIGEKTIPYIMPPERSVDIDTELDLKFAEFLITRDNH